MRLILLSVLGLFVFGCAHDVRARYPAAPAAPTGTLVLLLAHPADDVSVAVGGLLVVEDAHTKKVVIDGIPVGNAEVTMSANGGDKQFRVWIDDAHATTIPLGVPETSMGMAKSLIGTLITIVAYSMLR